MTRTMLLAVSAIALSATMTHAQEITFDDMAGRTITLSEPADRVVSMPIPLPPVIATTVGSHDTLVGMHPRAEKSINLGLAHKIWPELTKTPTDILVGSQFDPNVEEILKYDPDVVFQWVTSPIDVLENAGLTAVGVDTGHEEKLDHLLLLSGHVHGKTEKAEAIIERHVQVREDLAEQVAALPDLDSPRILYFYRFHGGWQTRGGTVESEYRNWYMRLVGAESVSEGGAASIDFTPEQALAWNPDIILLNNYEDERYTGSNLTPEDVYNDPFLSQTEAAKSRRVYKQPMGATWWDSGNQESPLLWKWMAMIAHPEHFNFDMRAEVKEWFEFLYDYDISEDEIDTVFHLADHPDALHYDRLARK
jgi:iron complex transport system substrate-binding protein